MTGRKMREKARYAVRQRSVKCYDHSLQTLIFNQSIFLHPGRFTKLQIVAVLPPKYFDLWTFSHP